MVEITLRPGTPADIARVRQLNHAAVPAVNDVDDVELARLSGSAVRFVVADHDDEVVGFVIVLAPGCEYDSLNYRWFSQRYDDFWYVDRVVVADTHRGCGVGGAIYRQLFDEAAEATVRICAEVNLVPRNQPSLDFHDRFGFSAVGTQRTEGGSKEVSLLVAEVVGSVEDVESAEVVGSVEDVEPAEVVEVVGSVEDVEPVEVAESVEGDEIGDLEADVATVERMLDGLGDMSHQERAMILDGLDAGADAHQVQA